jgi:hypothetical protein
LFLCFYSLLLQAWLQQSCSLYYNYVAQLFHCGFGYHLW